MATPFKQAKLTVDAGFHTEANMRLLFEAGFDAYVPDTQFRQRDPRFANAARHKPARAKAPSRRHFGLHDFVYGPEHQTCTCPAGKRLYLKNRHFETGGYQAVSFQAKLSDCRGCPLRSQCLQREDQSSSRQGEHPVESVLHRAQHRQALSLWHRLYVTR